MDEARAQSTDATSVAIAALDRRIDDATQYAQERISTVRELSEKDIKRLDEAITALNVLMDEREKLTQLAQSKFEDTVKNNDAKANEFRQALSDLSKEKATARELENALAQRDARIDELTKTVGELRSRLDVGPQGLRAVETQQQLWIGRGQGVSESAKLIVAAISAVGAILAILVLASNNVF